MKPSYRLFGASICLIMLTYFVFYIHFPSSFDDTAVLETGDTPSPQSTTAPSIGTVVASQSRDNTTWLPSLFPLWAHNVYVTDQWDATFSVPENKGREGMAYLTYLIDNYFSLPDVVIFLHAERYQWHNDDPLYDGARTLSRLQISYVQQQGYVNLRCVWTLGCPSELRPLDEQVEGEAIRSETRAGEVYATAFRELFPGAAVPESVGVSCCAQFAVSKEMILSRPREDYERYRQWLIGTDLDDGLSGRILEYSWHIIFGQKSVFCPSAKECYCNVFGLCNIICEGEGDCTEMYTLPHYSTLPEGWPWVGWDGKWQNATAVGQVTGEAAPTLEI